MLDIGWAELILIGVVALIVIGPKDLPDMFRTMGRFTAKMRAMARDFQRAMDQAAKDSGVQDVAKDLKAATSARSLGLDAVKDAASKFEKWDPIKNAATPTIIAPKSAAPVMPALLTPAPPVPVVPATAAPVGPATQALLDKKATKQAILKEAQDKIKALDSVPDAAPSAARKPRAPRKTAPETQSDA